ncbi:hypothetical protein MRQ47_004462 [Salmonella enterica]|nr:hypothetical protein [Salmonella enterica]
MISPEFLLPITGEQLRNLANIERQHQAQRTGKKFKRITPAAFRKHVVKVFGSEEEATKHIATPPNGKPDFYFSRRNALLVGLCYGSAIWEAVDRAVLEHELKKAQTGLELILELAKSVQRPTSTEEALHALEQMERRIGYLCVLGDFSPLHGCFDFILKDYILAGEDKRTIHRLAPQEREKVNAIIDSWAEPLPDHDIADLRQRNGSGTIH